MNAELRETIDLVRARDYFLREYENHCLNTLGEISQPIRLSIQRVRESDIDCLRKAIKQLGELWPKMDALELGKLMAGLDAGEIPKSGGLPGYATHFIQGELKGLETSATKKAHHVPA